MAVNDTRFGDMVLEHLQRLEKNPSWLARRLEVASSTVTRWLNGYNLPATAAHVMRIAEVLGIHNKKDKQALLAAAGFAYIEQEPVGEPETPAPELPAAIPAGPEFAGLQREQALQQMRRWWYEQPSGEEKFLALLRAGTGRITPPALLRLLLVLGTGWLACWLVIPLLLWPANSTAHHAASIKFGVATLLIPLLIALSTNAHPQVLLVTTTAKANTLLRLLQFTGALVCFYIATSVAVGAGLLLVSTHLLPMTAPLGGLLVLLCLLFGYWGARIIPTSRRRMFAEPRLHNVDRLVLFTFVLAGPLTAAFLHLNREMLADQGFMVILLVVLVGWLLWETRLQAQLPLRYDLVVVLFLGVVLPCIVFFLPLFLEGTLSVQGVRLADVAILAAYAVGQATLLAVLYLKRKANLFWPLLFWIFGAELLWLVVLVCRPELSPHFLAGLAALLFALWFLGRSRLQKYLWIHPSFWVMQIAFVLLLAAWVTIAGWPSVLLFLVAAGALIGWAALPEKTTNAALGSLAP